MTCLEKRPMRYFLTYILLLCCAGAWAAKPATGLVAKTSPDSRESRSIRVLVALGPSTYFFQGGKPHGVEYAWLLEFEKFINQGRKKTQQAKLQFIPVDPGELVPSLFEGRGDMAAGLLPASEGLRHLAKLTEPFVHDQWCVAGGKKTDLPDNLDEIASRSVILPASSYARRLLLDVNETRRLEGKPEIAPEDAGVGVTAEKLLGEIQSGGKQLTLVSRLTARLWEKTFPKVETGICLEISVPLVWAVQKDNPALLADLNRFISAKQHEFVTRGIELTRRYLSPEGVRSPSKTIDPLDKLAFFAPIFQLAASANNLDWLLLAAIGQRESGLTAQVRSSGPTGVMQVDPATAKNMGVKNPHDTHQNVTAAARYLNYLKGMFTSTDISAEDRLYFMLAAYNAGEGRLQGLRSKAKSEGLDPNRWHGNVEAVAKRSIGQNIVNYVTSVSRYYLAYQAADRKRQLESVRAASSPAAP